MEAITQRQDAPLNEEYEIFEDPWSKVKIKKKVSIGPRKGVSQENQNHIFSLKSHLSYPPGAIAKGLSEIVALRMSIYLYDQTGFGRMRP